MDKCNCIKLKIFLHNNKKTTKNNKNNQQNEIIAYRIEKIFANHISVKVLLSKYIKVTNFMTKVTLFMREKGTGLNR